MAACIVLDHLAALNFWTLLLGLILSIALLIAMIVSSIRSKETYLKGAKGLLICTLFFVAFLVLKSSIPSRHKAYVNPSGSMLPTLLIGDCLFADLKAYSSTPPNRDDVVVYKDSASGSLFMKRIVGIPGDTLNWDGQELTINGVKAEYGSPEGNIAEFQGLLMDDAQTYKLVSEKFGTTTHEILIRPDTRHIPVSDLKLSEGEYFVMGDNRDNSNDSRHRGKLALKDIIGKVNYIYFNKNLYQRFNRIGLVVD